MAVKMVSCARCGVEGERGEQPGEGRIVHGGGEPKLAPHANDLLCDDCADELEGRGRMLAPSIDHPSYKIGAGTRPACGRATTDDLAGPACVLPVGHDGDCADHDSED